MWAREWERARARTRAREGVAQMQGVRKWRGRESEGFEERLGGRRGRRGDTVLLVGISRRRRAMAMAVGGSTDIVAVDG